MGKKINRHNTGKRLFILSLLFLLTSCHHQEKITVPGYIEGQYAYVAPQFGGVLKSLSVERGNEVKIGQILFSLDPQPEDSDLQSAQARLQQAQAQLRRAQDAYQIQKIYFNRRLKLRNTISKEDMDVAFDKLQEASTSLSSAQNNVVALQAELRKSTWTAKQKTIAAPMNGLIFDTYYVVGESVTAGNPVLSILNPDKVKVIFYIPERFLGQLRLKQLVNISCDNCNKNTRGQIVFISPQAEYTPPIIYSNEAKEKLVYRIEAKPLISNAYLELHPGQPIMVTVK